MASKEFKSETNDINESHAFTVGTVCLLTDLITMSSMNGKEVRIMKPYNKKERRYAVYVYETKDVVLIKPNNLKIIKQTAEIVDKRYQKIYWTQKSNPLSKIHKQGIKFLESMGWKRVIHHTQTNIVPLFALTTRKEVSKYDKYYQMRKSSELPFVRQLPNKITEILDNKKLLSLKLKSNGCSHVMPQTHEDIASFIKLNEQKESFDCIWYLKHSKGCKGKQIDLLYDMNSLKECFKLSKQRMSDYILQKEIKPLLTRDGRKFAVRAHAAICSKNNKFNVWFHRKCIVLPNAKCYDANNIKDKSIHIQNIAKKLPKACLLDNAYCLSLKNVDNVFDQMKNITRSVFGCVENEMDNFVLECAKESIVGRYYHLFGFDFMIDQEEKVQLLEINAFPAIGNGTMSHVNKAIFTDLIKDLIDVLFTTKDDLKQISSFVLLY